ncbi:MAG: ABC transporter permease subunit [Candidatus Rokubacteria bacterium]|nr:ABC transporter permease subunit [Candidatus Rokubacteria bacterium]
MKPHASPAVMLSVRERLYVQAAISLGVPAPLLVARHVLPDTLASLIGQATYVRVSAILVEAIVSFLGVGIPAQTPTWRNIMAEGRILFRLFPHNILDPGMFLALTVLAVTRAGDGPAPPARSPHAQAELT